MLRPLRLQFSLSLNYIKTLDGSIWLKKHVPQIYIPGPRTSLLPLDLLPVWRSMPQSCQQLWMSNALTSALCPWALKVSPAWGGVTEPHINPLLLKSCALCDPCSNTDSWPLTSRIFTLLGWSGGDLSEPGENGPHDSEGLNRSVYAKGIPCGQSQNQLILKRRMILCFIPRAVIEILPTLFLPIKYHRKSINEQCDTKQLWLWTQKYHQISVYQWIKNQIWWC